YKNAGGTGLAESWNDTYAVHAPVGSFDPNSFGLHDVLGNAWEWCRDCCGRYELKPRPGDGLRTPSTSYGRVLRGGSFHDPASIARSAFRDNGTPDSRDHTLGVRPARQLDR